MSICITVANQAGGSGKTTTVANLGAAFAFAGYRTLLIDFSSSCDLTIEIGIERNSITKDVLSLLTTGEVEIIEQVFKQIDLSLIPGSRNLVSMAESQLPSIYSNNNQLLKLALARYKDDFDIVLIDTPPGVAPFLLSNALAASDYLIVPSLCQRLSIERLKNLVKSIETLKKQDEKIELLAVIPTMHNKAENAEKWGLAELQNLFGELCAKPVSNCVEYVDASIEHRPVSGVQGRYWQSFVGDIIRHIRNSRLKTPV